MSRPAPERLRRIALGPGSAAAWRFLAVLASAALLAVLLVFGAAQGALDGAWSGAPYWRRYWPLWMPLAPAAAAFAAALAGRMGWCLALMAASLLLASGAVLAD